VVIRYRMSARVIAVTTPVQENWTAEDLIVYVARVSNPTTQNTASSPERLIRYCVDNKHWSVFETVSVTIEIETTRAIASQILRHRSFTFQEFSQRYAVVETDPEPQRARSPHPRNRQASLDTLPDDVQTWWRDEQKKSYEASSELYVRALERGIAKECARFVLPLATPTKLYMTGNIRNWIHYVDMRSGNGTQKEHADIADSIRDILAELFPITASALGW